MPPEMRKVLQGVEILAEGSSSRLGLAPSVVIVDDIYLQQFWVDQARRDSVIDRWAVACRISMDTDYEYIDAGNESRSSIR